MTYQNSFLSSSEPYNFKIENVDFNYNNLSVQIIVDESKLFNIKSEDKRMLSFVYETFDPKPIQIPIRLEMPKVYISVSSVDKYQSTYMHYLKDAIKDGLGEQNLLMANSLKEADYHIIITAHESEGPEQQKFKSVYLSYALEVFQMSNNNMIHSQSIPQVKGVDITFEKAKEKAYLKASEEFEYQYAKSFIKNILQ
jgi:hypothetical protein